MNKFISWRRVSTKRQKNSGLGLEAQSDIINYFVNAENGELIADYSEAYTGKDLSGCNELQKAIKHCKETGAKLIIAKTDRFRNVIEALQIFDEMNGNIYFCDIPHTDKFTLTLFFALAEREALMVSIRTKAALKAKKERGEVWNKNKSFNRTAIENSAKSRNEKAQKNEFNKAFFEFITDYQKIHGKIDANTDFKPIAEELNRRGKRTSTGLEFTSLRARSMYNNTKELYIYTNK